MNSNVTGKTKLVYFYLTLIRHGQTNANVENIIQGHMDTELSPVGIEQARALRQPLSSIPIDLVLSSDLRRASVTACELAPTASVEKDPRLRERDFGSYCGTSRAALQKFAESNSETGAGCDGWRAIGGECSHQMANRTYTFLLDLCHRMVQSAVRCQPSMRTTNPVFPGSDHPSTPEIIARNCKIDRSEFTYGGHVVIVSHGGWIRHLLRLLALKCDTSWYFPKHCVNTVMRNCCLCQVGVAFDAATLHRQTSTIQDTPIPVFGNLSESGGPTVNCPYYSLANRNLPLLTVCYHFDLNLSDVSLKIGPRKGRQEDEVCKHSADKLCSKMEVIFSDDGDEYAGLPGSKPSNSR